MRRTLLVNTANKREVYVRKIIWFPPPLCPSHKQLKWLWCATKPLPHHFSKTKKEINLNTRWLLGGRKRKDSFLWLTETLLTFLTISLAKKWGGWNKGIVGMYVYWERTSSKSMPLRRINTFPIWRAKLKWEHSN